MAAAPFAPQDAGLTPPSLPSEPSKPTILHLGDDIRWNHNLYATLQSKFTIIRTYSMDRETFKTCLKEKKWGEFVAMYRPFWNTGGEMGNWNEELMYVAYPSPHASTHACILSGQKTDKV